MPCSQIYLVGSSSLLNGQVFVGCGTCVFYFNFKKSCPCLENIGGVGTEISRSATPQNVSFSPSFFVVASIHCH